MQREEWSSLEAHPRPEKGEAAPVDTKCMPRSGNSREKQHSTSVSYTPGETHGHGEVQKHPRVLLQGDYFYPEDNSQGETLEGHLP